MTPLYYRIVKRLTLPAKKRELLYDPQGLLNNLSEVHLGAGRSHPATPASRSGRWNRASYAVTAK
jgi:hypothetical protein